MVPEGLAEADVSAFVEDLMSQYREANERLEHIDAIHELARRTLQESEELVQNLNEEARKKADAKAWELISEATKRAREIIDVAERGARGLKEAAKTESQKQVVERFFKDAGARAQPQAQRIEAQVKTAANAQVGKFAGSRNLAPDNRPGGVPHHKGKRTAQPGTGETPGSRSRPTFRWKTVPGATRYGLYVAGPPYGRVPFVFSREDITGTSLALPFDLDEGVTYHWTVRAGNSWSWGRAFPFKRYTP